MFELTDLEKKALKKSLRPEFDYSDKKDRAFNVLMEKLETYQKRRTYGTLMDFNVTMYLGYRYREDVMGEYPNAEWFIEMKSRLKEKITSLSRRAVLQAAADGNSRLIFRFEQSKALDEASIQSSGVCHAMSMDWLRRRMSIIVGNHKLLFGQMNMTRLMHKMDELQQVGGFYSYKNVKQMEKVLLEMGQRKETPSLSTSKGFLDLHRAKKTSERGLRQSEEIDEEYQLGPQFTGFATQLRFPRAVLFSFHRRVDGALAGHTVAFFHSHQNNDWEFFDANYGEYSVKNISAFVNGWNLLYKPIGTKPKVIGFSLDLW